MKKVKILSGHFKDQDYVLEGLWKEITGKSWMFSDGNPACLQYAIRSAKDDLPTDDKVYYGKIGALGHLIHESELKLGGCNEI